MIDHDAIKAFDALPDYTINHDRAPAFVKRGSAPVYKYVHTNYLFSIFCAGRDSMAVEKQVTATARAANTQDRPY